MCTPLLFAAPYIHYPAQTREALEFYQTLLGGTLDLLTQADDGSMRPAKPGERIIHARLKSDYAVIMASDSDITIPDNPNDRISISLIGSDQDKLSDAFSTLSADGGSVVMSLAKSSWGDMFGIVKDKFYVTWMFNITTAEHMTL